MEGSHALSLKVMRLSRPSLATAAQPYFGDHHPLLTEHAASSVLSLESSSGASSSARFPSTMRDFALSETLSLSATFGSIQLGETFSGLVTVNNDSFHPGIEVSSVQLKVEMQTSTAKLPIGGTKGDASDGATLKPATFLETAVHHEIKELGQHVLACTLSYRIPAAIAGSYPIPPDDQADPLLRTLRKYYKFMVTNPLSVKTKVQTVKSTDAQLLVSEREKLFLEVHIQNLTQKPMSFQRIRFECVEGWAVEDMNEGVYGVTAAIMPAQEVRQYLYVLTPLSVLSDAPRIITPPLPGSVIPLGRLDISWTTSFGEPGRLLTSLLSRRVPMEGPPPNALPPHIQPQAKLPLARPQSPPVGVGSSLSRPSSPSPANAPPFKVRERPKSPSKMSMSMSSNAPIPPINTNVPSAIALALPPPPEYRASLVIRSRPPRDAIRAREPFTIGYTLTLGPATGSTSTSLDPKTIEELGTAIQFLEPDRALLDAEDDLPLSVVHPHPGGSGIGPAPAPTPVASVLGMGLTPVSARGNSNSVGFGGREPQRERSQITVGSPIALQAASSPASAFQPFGLVSPEQQQLHERERREELQRDEADHQPSTYPAPHVASPSSIASNPPEEAGVRHVGPSILRLPPPIISQENDSESYAFFDFDADFVAIGRGLQELGSGCGIRVLDARQRVLAEWRNTGQVLVV